MCARKSVFFTLFVVSFFFLSSSHASSPSWLEVEVGIIGTASEDILNTAIEECKVDGHKGLLIKLDTPGGALENTRAMVKSIMSAPFPVVVWVGPSGSRAGSAGAFITLSAHVAAMAEGTNVGAAHPVSATGGSIGGGKKEDSKDMELKVMNDTLAFIESIASERGRNVEMARSFVATSVSITAEEALKHNVIDLIAPDVPTLMGSINGKKIKLQSGKEITLATTGVTLATFSKSLRQKILEILSNPNLFYLLFLAGVIGLGYELTHPGVFLPGVAGAICLILALIATSVLPVSFGAAALILVGIGLMIAEAFVPSFGVLGIGGFVAFILGSVFLVDPANEMGLRVSYLAIAPGAVVVAGVSALIAYLILRTERSQVASGREGMIGQSATVTSDFIGGKGHVRASGALWKANASEEGLSFVKGDEVIVSQIDGLELTIKVKE